MTQQTPTRYNHWMEVIGNLTDKLTGRNLSMTYEFDDLTLDIPTTRGPGGGDMGEVECKINGKITVSVEAIQRNV